MYGVNKFATTAYGGLVPSVVEPAEEVVNPYCKKTGIFSLKDKFVAFSPYSNYPKNC